MSTQRAIITQGAGDAQVVPDAPISKLRDSVRISEAHDALFVLFFVWQDMSPESCTREARLTTEGLPEIGNTNSETNDSMSS